MPLGFVPALANLMCGLGQVTSPVWVSISPTAKYGREWENCHPQVGNSLSFCLPPILWAKSAQGGAAAAGLGRDGAVRVSVQGEPAEAAGPASTSMAALKLLTSRLIFFFFGGTM